MSIAFPKNKLIILILATIGLWLAGGFFTYFFLMRDIKNLNSAIAEKRRDLDQASYYSQNFARFSADYDKAALDAERIDEAILDQDSFIIFIQKLEKIAEDNNLKQEIDLGKQAKAAESAADLKKKKEEKAVPSLPFLPVAYRLELEGAFPDFVRCLQAIENLNNYTNLRNVSINLKNEASKEGEARQRNDLIQAMMEAEVYTAGP
ncbi:hypothetical protein COT68_00050 [bacterium (Candidatus Torokbacteria) CG09_land_8_20_14_0_10_42_11]|nr:MAG: hypothetical protein COT68_00050 [bacterium (Candidatus Torokbacteria) CG09_land_8_20_14_0_10_42_11]